MRKLIAVALCLLVVSVQAKPSQEDIQFCGALSTYVHAVSMNKLSGVPEDKAYDVLISQNGQIAPSLVTGINSIIDFIYSTTIRSGAEQAAIVSKVYTDCLKQRK